MARPTKHRNAPVQRVPAPEPIERVERSLRSSQPKTISISQSVTQTATYEGPIPPPGILEEYDRILPGLADRIVQQWERQTIHRIEIEKIAINGDNYRANMGLWFGFTLALVGFSIGGFLIYLGLVNAGIAVMLGHLATMVGIFVYGTRSRRRERENKARTMARHAPASKK